jgi:hypothetical protein
MEIKAKGLKSNKLELIEDIVILGVKIPKGFKSDGLTLKTRFLGIFVDRFAPKFWAFIFLHDFLCQKEEYFKADTLGGKLLFSIEYSFRTRIGMMLIEAYHFIKYKKYRQEILYDFT